MSVPSVAIAKDRLKNLLMSDRIQCTPDMTERLYKGSVSGNRQVYGA